MKEAGELGFEAHFLACSQHRNVALMLRLRCHFSVGWLNDVADVFRQR
jgi:hypothetical protein